MATAGSNTSTDQTNACSASLEMKKGQGSGGGTSGSETNGNKKVSGKV